MSTSSTTNSAKTAPHDDSPFGRLSQFLHEPRANVLVSLAWLPFGLLIARSAPRLGLASSAIDDVVNFLAPLTTIGFVVWNAYASVLLLYRTGRTLVALPITIAQVLLFTLFFFQVAMHGGAVHYDWTRPPGFGDWLLLAAAHAVRATDVLDVVQAYDVPIQTIAANSHVTALALVVYHLVVSVFFLGLFTEIVRWSKSHWLTRPGRRRALMFVGAAGLLALFIGWALTALVYSPWERRDLFLWPLDNLLRVVDFFDLMEIYHWRLHRVPAFAWEGTLTLACRIAIAVVLADFIDRFTRPLRLKWLWGFGMTNDDLVSLCDGHRRWEIRQLAAARLAARQAAAPELQAQFDRWRSPRTRIGVVAMLVAVMFMLLVPAGKPPVSQLAATALGTDAGASGRAHRALRRMGSAAAECVPLLERGLPQQPAESRLEVIQTLGYLDEPACAALGGLLKEEDPLCRAAAVDALARIGSPAIPTLAVGLSSSHEETREACLAVLARQGYSAAQVIADHIAPESARELLPYLNTVDPYWPRRYGKSPYFHTLVLVRRDGLRFDVLGKDDKLLDQVALLVAADGECAQVLGVRGNIMLEFWNASREKPQLLRPSLNLFLASEIAPPELKQRAIDDPETYLPVIAEVVEIATAGQSSSDDASVSPSLQILRETIDALWEEAKNRPELIEPSLKLMIASGKTPPNIGERWRDNSDALFPILLALATNGSFSTGENRHAHRLPEVFRQMLREVWAASAASKTLLTPACTLLLIFDAVEPELPNSLAADPQTMVPILLQIYGTAEPAQRESIENLFSRTLPKPVELQRELIEMVIDEDLELADTALAWLARLNLDMVELRELLQSNEEFKAIDKKLQQLASRGDSKLRLFVAELALARDLNDELGIQMLRDAGSAAQPMMLHLLRLFLEGDVSQQPAAAQAMLRIDPLAEHTTAACMESQFNDFDALWNRLQQGQLCERELAVRVLLRTSPDRTADVLAIANDDQSLLASLMESMTPAQSQAVPRLTAGLIRQRKLREVFARALERIDPSLASVHAAGAGETTANLGEWLADVLESEDSATRRIGLSMSHSDSCKPKFVRSLQDNFQRSASRQAFAALRFLEPSAIDYAAAPNVYDAACQQIEFLIDKDMLAEAQVILGECPTALREWEWGLQQRRTSRDPRTRNPVCLPEPDHQGFAFSPDGRYFAAANANDSVSLRHAATGNLVRSLKGHSDSIWSVAFSSDGKRVASSSSDGTVQVWNTEDGERVLTVTATQDADEAVSNAFFTLDDKQLVSLIYRRDALYAWSSTSGDLIHHLGVGIYDVRSAPDGRGFATRGGGGVDFWDASTGERRNVSDKFSSSMPVFSRNGRLLAAASGDSVLVWDRVTGEVLRTLAGHANEMAFHPNGRSIACGYQNATIRLWDLNTGKTKHILQGHSAGVLGLAFSLNGRRLASITEGKAGKAEVYLWNAETGCRLCSLKGFEGHLSKQIEFSPDGKRLAAWAYGRLTIWNGEPMSAAPADH